MGVTYCPFTDDSHCRDWMAANCFRCARYPFNLDEPGNCEILPVVLESLSDDGAVPERTVRRMGYLDHLHHDPRIWPCPEFLEGPGWVAVFGMHVKTSTRGESFP